MSENQQSDSPVGMMALATGLFLIATGLLGIGIYVAGAVRLILQEDPDRSWIWWGLGIAAIGATLLVGGIVLLVLWRRMEAESVQD